MSCFSLGFLEQLLVWIVIVCAIVSVIKLVVPWLASLTMPIVGQIIMIVLWAIVAIMVIYLIFALLSCLVSMGGGGLHLPR